MNFRIIVMRKRNYNQLKLVDCENFLKSSLGTKHIKHAVFGQRNKPALKLTARGNSFQNYVVIRK